jgi:hypothetical protein
MILGKKKMASAQAVVGDWLRGEDFVKKRCARRRLCWPSSLRVFLNETVISSVVKTVLNAVSQTPFDYEHECRAGAAAVAGPRGGTGV